MNESENKREFKVLTDIEHVLLRPNMYIGGINLAEKEFGLLTEYVVDIDTYQYLYLFDLFKFLTKFEIARTSEISYYCLKGMKIEHIVGYSLELLEQGIIGCIIKKLSAHLYLLRLLALPPFPQAETFLLVCMVATKTEMA